MYSKSFLARDNCNPSATVCIHNGTWCKSLHSMVLCDLQYILQNGKLGHAIQMHAVVKKRRKISMDGMEAVTTTQKEFHLVNRHWFSHPGTACHLHDHCQAYIASNSPITTKRARLILTQTSVTSIGDAPFHHFFPALFNFPSNAAKFHCNSLQRLSIHTRQTSHRYLNALDGHIIEFSVTFHCQVAGTLCWTDNEQPMPWTDHSLCDNQYTTESAGCKRGCNAAVWENLNGKDSRMAPIAHFDHAPNDTHQRWFKEIYLSHA